MTKVNISRLLEIVENLFGALLFKDECSYIIIIATITKSKIKSSLGPMLST